MPPKRSKTTKIIKKKMIEHLCKLIKNESIKLPAFGEKGKPQARFWTPFSKKQGVCISRNGEENLFVHGGNTQSYKQIAISIHGKYKKKHLEIISEYLNLDCNNSVRDLATFNKYIKDKIDNTPKWKDACNDLSDSTRKALNYFSAILMIAEPFGFNCDGTKSRTAINQMIKDYKSRSNTPSKHLRGRGTGPYKIFNKGSRKTFGKKGRESAFYKLKPLPEEDWDSSLDEDEDKDYSPPPRKYEFRTRKLKPMLFFDSDSDSSDNDLTSTIPGGRSPRISIKPEKKEMKEERNTSPDDSSDSYSGRRIMRMSVDSESEKEEVKERKEKKQKKSED